MNGYYRTGGNITTGIDGINNCIETNHYTNNGSGRCIY